MGAANYQQFFDAVKEAKKAGLIACISKWESAVRVLNRLAMSDMLRALSALTALEVAAIGESTRRIKGMEEKRVGFAEGVVLGREIKDYGLPRGEVNDGRQYLGCTRLDDTEVQQIINATLNRAKIQAAANPKYRSDRCCGPIRYAWLAILVPERQQPGKSLISNLAAAAHYMLARYKVCSADAREWQMRKAIELYDDKKRIKIQRGEKELKSMGLTGNRPFPPDFAIRDWGFKGAHDGEMDRLRCNSEAWRPLLTPNLDGEVGE